MQEAKRRGLDWFQPHHAAGMAGSFMQETGDFREDVINFKVKGDKNTAHGLMQWRGDRWQNLQKFAKENNAPLDNINTQISFAFEEMDPSSKLSDFGSVKAAKQMRTANNVKDSAIAFVHAERPAGYDGDPRRANDAGRRIEHATRAFSSVNSNNPVNIAQAQNIPTLEHNFGKGTIRNKEIQPQLQQAITQSGANLGISRVVVFSGGQDGKGQGSRRTGSIRHDHGGAADIRLYDSNNKIIRPDDPKNAKLLSQYAANLRQNGVSGIGAGAGYMGGNAIHVGYGKDTVWGAGGRSANAPDWLKNVQKSVPLGDGKNIQASNFNVADVSTRGADTQAPSFSQDMINKLQMAGFDGSDFGINSNFGMQEQAQLGNGQQLPVNTFQPVDFGIQQIAQDVDFGGGSGFIDFGQQQQLTQPTEPTPVLAPKNEVFAENGLTLSETFDNDKSIFGV